jgi:transposase
MNKKCEICEKPLVGKQQRFCSKRCRNIFAGRRNGPRLKPPDKEWLAQEYLLPPEGKGRSQPDISKELGVSKVTLRKWIRAYGLQQDPNERVGHFQKENPKYSMPSRDWLFDQYIEKNKSIREIATEIGCSVGPIIGWLRKHGITKSSEQLAATHSRRMSGKDNPAYTNGNSNRYTRRKLAKVKPKICGWCKTTEDVQVHHIDHNRENNEFDNLTWLCGTCNRLEANLWLLAQSNRIMVSREANRLVIEFKE